MQYLPDVQESISKTMVGSPPKSPNETFRRRELPSPGRAQFYSSPYGHRRPSASFDDGAGYSGDGRYGMDSADALETELQKGATHSRAATEKRLEKGGMVGSMKDDENEEDDEQFDEFHMPMPNYEGLEPNYEGFKAFTRRLNPNMDAKYDWLVSRIAHQQEVRYKNLLDLRVGHCRAVSNRTCSAGPHCLALGGDATLLDARGKPRVSDQGGRGLQLVTDFSDNESVSEEGVFTNETFPPGIPMPPARRLPAEFECQLCFKAKKFLKPSDWTKHVHEDIQPFTCTYEHCKDPKSFRRKADWVRHENERHRHLEWWICQVDDCRHPCYRKDNFEQHLIREHKLPESKQKNKAAIKQALRHRTEPLWNMLERCHHKTTNKPQDEPCKFCGKQYPTWKKLTVHLAKHMEQISVPVLRLVEMKSVNAYGVISPVEQILSPLPHTSEMDVEPLDHNWDLESIASLNTFRDSALGSSLKSDISHSVAQGLPRTAQEEILSILNSDAQLQSLFLEAARRISKDRFVRNIRRSTLR